MFGFLIIVFIVIPGTVSAGLEADTLKTARAVRASGHISPDGILNESDWKSAPEITGFRQYEPHEGEPCSQRTVGKVLYDDEAIYLGFWLYDSEPEKIIPILTRRDRWSESDFISVRLDTHHDHQSAYYFNVNAAGVQRDIMLYNNTNADESWDAVYEANAKIYDWGWTAEFKIPYSALRFASSEKYIWGLQMGRYIGRSQEDARWQFTPEKETRGVSRYGHLVGIEGIEPPSRMEVLPYVVQTGIYEPETKGNPDGRTNLSDIGVDFKYGLSSAFTLDATINPDFGQVESDESILNLTAYETFYPEKRPFFIEGFDIFRTLYFDQFYSRRIGRAPSGSVENKDFYYDYPRGTNILGAFKLTGKTTGGTSIGVLNATTREEQAEYAIAGSDEHFKAVVEPLANYSVARIKQDIFGKSYIGGMFTAVNQKERTDAYTASADWSIYLPDDNYYWDGQLLGTRNGPGTNDFAAMTELCKESGKNIRGNVLFDYYGENVDWNRLGYINIVGYWGSSTWWQIRSNKEAGIIRYANVNINAWYNEYFDGLKFSNGGNINSNLQFTNNWWIWSGVGYNGDRYEKREIPGNGHWLSRRGFESWVGGRTNESKNISGNFQIEYFKDRGGYGRNYYLGSVIRPKANLEFELDLGISDYTDNQYWVGTGEDDLPVFGALDQNVFNFSLRSIYTFTKNLSLQWYSQFYVSAGEYGKYYRMLDPENLEEVDPGEYGIEMERDDFNYKSLNINLILRWEFRPGSTFYLVWTQARDRYDTGNPIHDYSLSLSRDFDEMFALPQTNTFLAKINYWWNI